MIYSPNCTVFRDDDGNLLEQPYQVDFITAAAPNRGAISRNQTEALQQIDQVFTQRIEAILRLAIHNKCDALILGAWGCGVFANLPENVADYFNHAINHKMKLGKYFKYISFSIPDHSKTNININAFTKVFKDKK